MVRMFHCLAAATLVFSTNIGAARAAPHDPLACDYAKVDKIIRCTVQEAGVGVLDASVNDGKCRSPLQVFEDNKLMMKRNFGVDMEGVASFVRSYDKGESFSLNVDKGCAVYKYSVKIKDRTIDFDVPESASP